MTDSAQTPPTAPVLEFRDLRVDFALASSTVHAVRGVSFAVNSGETLAVVGESGSGKSATALSALRLNPEPPCVYAGGQVLLDGKDVLGLREKELRKVRSAGPGSPWSSRTR
nr:ATP-binding cassette domain-containing protein [Streptomyces poriferorum]